MTTIPHELLSEFPAEADKIEALKESDGHFARLAEEYEEINRAVHAAETNLEPTDEAHEIEMRRRRVQLKDEIWHRLQAG
ncbi:YdcH family protein [Acidimangrovimonas pyrenivorans]|uniref:YdcH family protein n=1 Tax=Acidimangrovimonas pyrenivorans TaxID=2030798 RepID=A0ABV7AIW3_9RHOB